MAITKNKPTEEEIDFMKSSVGKQEPKKSAIKQKNDYTASADDLEYMKSAVESSSKSESDLPWYRSYFDAPVSGLIKGLTKVGSAFSGPSPDVLMGRTTQEQEAQQREEVLKQYLPVEGFIPKAISHATESVVESAGMPGGVLPSVLRRAAIGGIGAEGLKEMGAPEWAQNAFEFGTQLVPGFERGIPRRGFSQAANTERNLIAEAERLGLTPEEYALTINQRGPVTDFLQEVSAKGGRTVGRFQRTREALGRVWNTLRNTPEAQSALNSQDRFNLVSDMSRRLRSLPAEQRNRIMEDWQDLLQSQMRGVDIIDFWQKLNYYIPRGEAGLGVLKEYLQNSLTRISPQLAHDFQVSNTLYGNFHRLSERMGPNVAESLIRAGENGIVITAISTGNFPLLKKVLGPVLARQLSAELTTNPRFMNLSSRLINSIERGSATMAKKAYDQLVVEVGKNNAEAAMKMSGFDFDKFLQALPDKESKQSQEKTK